jgi:hypothetical protein
VSRECEGEEAARAAKFEGGTGGGASGDDGRASHARSTTSSQSSGFTVIGGLHCVAVTTAALAVVLEGPRMFAIDPGREGGALSGGGVTVHFSSSSGSSACAASSGVGVPEGVGLRGIGIGDIERGRGGTQVVMADRSSVRFAFFAMAVNR